MELPAIGGAAALSQRPAAALSPTPVAAGSAGPAKADAAPAAAPVDKADAAKGAETPAELRQVKETVKDINKAMQALSRNIEFSIDTDSQRTVVKVIDQQTKEVIRQMPTAEALEIGKALEKVQGLLIRQTA